MAISDATLTALDELLAKIAADGIQSVQDGNRIVNRQRLKDIVELDRYLSDKHEQAESGNFLHVEFENPE